MNTINDILYQIDTFVLRVLHIDMPLDKDGSLIFFNFFILFMLVALFLLLVYGPLKRYSIRKAYERLPEIKEKVTIINLSKSVNRYATGVTTFANTGISNVSYTTNTSYEVALIDEFQVKKNYVATEQIYPFLKKGKCVITSKGNTIIDVDVPTEP